MEPGIFILFTESLFEIWRLAERAGTSCSLPLNPYDIVSVLVIRGWLSSSSLFLSLSFSLFSSKPVPLPLI